MSDNCKKNNNLKRGIHLLNSKQNDIQIIICGSKKMRIDHKELLKFLNGPGQFFFTYIFN